MSFPSDDLYAFLRVDREAATEDRLREAIAAEERSLAGKHGLSLAELSRRRSLLLQAKRWLLSAERREAYDAQLASGAPAGDLAPRRAAPSTRTPLAKVSSDPAGKGSATAPIVAPPTEPSEEVETEDAGFNPLSLPVLAGLAVAGIVLSVVGAVGISWMMSDAEVATPAAPTIPEAVAPPPEVAAETPDESVVADWVMPNLDEEIVLTATNAKLVGEAVRVDAADGPPHVENWTGTDALEWRFESTTPTVYRATLEYAMEPASKGGRYQVVAGTTTVVRTVGGGAFADGAYRDDFYLAVKSRGLVTLRIEPVEVLGTELMQFRGLKLTPRQRSGR